MRFVWMAVLFGCAAAARAPAPAELEFARAYLRRPVAPEAEAGARAGAADRSEPVPAPAAGDELDGLVTPREAADLAKPVAREVLESMVVQRSRRVAASRARYEAARTGYRQATDLRDLVATYRAFTRETRVRVGPDAMDPAPIQGLDALSSAIVRRTVGIAFERLRASIRDAVVAAEKAHADAARLAGARRVLAENVALHESLVATVRARYESGRAEQAGLLAFESRLQTLRTELAVLEEMEAVVRARWNELLHRPESAPLALDVEADEPREPGPAAVDVEQRQEYRAAVLEAERAALAVRAAETMTFPPMEAKVAPGRPRSEFGVREAQVREMRARKDAAEKARDAARDRTRTQVRAARFGRDAAWRRFKNLRDEIVPRATKAYQSAAGAYEGNRIGYIELLDSARRLLDARLGLIDARRDCAYARADLLAATGTRRSS